MQSGSIGVWYRLDVLWSSSGGEGMKVGSVAIGPANDVGTGERKSYRGTCKHAQQYHIRYSARGSVIHFR
jgi:hypothetical protein